MQNVLSLLFLNYEVVMSSQEVVIFFNISGLL